MAGILLERAQAIAPRIVALRELGATTTPQIDLSFAMWGLCHDETSRLLTLTLPLPFATQQRRSSWHVLVSTSTFDVLWSTANTENLGMIQKHWCFDVARPNVPLMSTTAEDLFLVFRVSCSPLPNGTRLCGIFFICKL